MSFLHKRYTNNAAVFDHRSNTWMVGNIPDRSNRSYTVKLPNGKIIHRNRVDLRPTSVQFPVQLSITFIFSCFYFILTIRYIGPAHHALSRYILYFTDKGVGTLILVLYIICTGHSFCLVCFYFALHFWSTCSI